jgi:hypothetical protein
MLTGFWVTSLLQFLLMPLIIFWKSQLHSCEFEAMHSAGVEDRRVVAGCANEDAAIIHEIDV